MLPQHPCLTHDIILEYFFFNWTLFIKWSSLFRHPYPSILLNPPLTNIRLVSKILIHFQAHFLQFFVDKSFGQYDYCIGDY